MKKTKIGDVFLVKIAEGEKKYFQYICNDLIQLNSDVIRVFKKVYSVDDNPSIIEVITDDVEFYAHCVTKFGIKSGLWEKIGNTPEVGRLDHILFRGSKDSGHKVGDERVTISDRWYVWKLNDKDFRVVGKLEGENRKAELGIVVISSDIISRIKTGEYEFFYPGFE